MQFDLRGVFPRRRLDPLVQLLVRLGVTPNTITWAGCLLSAGSGLLAGAGAVAVAGWLSLIAGGLDLFDGAVARATNRATRAGALLDSTLDRYSEGFILAGLFFYSASAGATVDGLLAFAALLGSLMVSYVKARAEGLDTSCDVGLMTRPERVVVLGVGMVTGWLTPALAIVAVLANVTAVHRLIHAWRKLEQQDRP